MARKGIVERGFFARSTRVLPARTLPARPSAQVSAPAVSLAGPWCTDYEQQLAGHAWAAAPHASPADRSAAADAGALAAARARAAAPSGDGEEPVNEAGSAAARMTAQCADAVSRQGDRPGTVAPADWTAFGVVVPVLSASPGSGASVAAMAIADAAQLAGGQSLALGGIEIPGVDEHDVTIGHRPQPQQVTGQLGYAAGQHRQRHAGEIAGDRYGRRVEVAMRVEPHNGHLAVPPLEPGDRP